MAEKSESTVDKITKSDAYKYACRGVKPYKTINLGDGEATLTLCLKDGSWAVVCFFWVNGGLYDHSLPIHRSPKSKRGYLNTENGGAEQANVEYTEQLVIEYITNSELPRIKGE